MSGWWQNIRLAWARRTAGENQPLPGLADQLVWIKGPLIRARRASDILDELSSDLLAVVPDEQRLRDG